MPVNWDIMSVDMIQAHDIMGEGKNGRGTDMQDWKNRIGNILMMLTGIVCVIWNEHILSYLPLLFSSMMIFKGLMNIIQGYKNQDFKKLEETGFAKGIVITVVGIGVLIHHNDALEIVAVFWGVLGLLKSVSYLNEFMYKLTEKEKCLRIGAEFVLEFILAILVIFDPEGNIGHHIIILGCEFVLYAMLEMHPLTRREGAKVKKYF